MRVLFVVGLLMLAGCARSSGLTSYQQHRREHHFYRNRILLKDCSQSTIQRAIDSAVPGTEIDVPPCTQILSGPIYIRSSWIILRGTVEGGVHKTKFLVMPNQWAFQGEIGARWTAISGFHFELLSFDQPKLAEIRQYLNFEPYTNVFVEPPAGSSFRNLEVYNNTFH